MNKIGQIVLLKHGSFQGDRGKFLIDTHHMFLVVDTFENMLIVCPISSQVQKINTSRLNIRIGQSEKTGLNKPSYVTLGTRGLVNSHMVHRVVGIVPDKDLKIISDAYLGSSTTDLLEQTQMVLEFYKKGYNNHEL